MTLNLILQKKFSENYFWQANTKSCHPDRVNSARSIDSSDFKSKNDWSRAVAEWNGWGERKESVVVFMHTEPLSYNDWYWDGVKKIPGYTLHFCWCYMKFCCFQLFFEILYFHFLKNQRGHFLLPFFHFFFFFLRKWCLRFALRFCEDWIFMGFCFIFYFRNFIYDFFIFVIKSKWISN